MSGASSDPFSGYAWDGDERWTVDLVRSWWAERDLQQTLVEQLIEGVAGPRPPLGSDYADLLFRCCPVGGYSIEERANMRSLVTEFFAFRRTATEQHLCRYIYFLDHGSYPADDDLLPDL